MYSNTILYFNSKWNFKMADEKVEPQSLQLSQIREFSIPNHYFNGFEIGSSLSDIGCLLVLDGAPQARLSMSFTTAKTLAYNLGKVIAQFEKTTNHQIMTTEDVKKSYDQNVE